MRRMAWLALLVAVPAAALDLGVVFTEVPHATGYRIYVRQVPSPWPTASTPIPVTPTPGETPGEIGARVPVGATPGATLEVAVTAFDAEQESAFSNVIALAVATWTPTATASATPTRTAVDTATLTRTATETATVIPTSTATASAVPTRTALPRPTLRRVWWWW